MSEILDIAAALSRLLKAENVLLICHKNPDGDTIGSAAALYWALKGLGKTVAVLCADPIPSRYDYMDIGLYTGQFTPGYTVAVDVAGIQLFGDSIAEYTRRIDMCIDHHPSNSGSADCMLLDGDAAATAEIIYELLTAIGTEITPTIADCLYTGLSTDTGCFKFANTTARTHEIAAKLITAGASLVKLNNILFESKSRSRLAIERLALESLEYSFGGRCATVYLTKEQIAETGADGTDLEGITSLPRMIEGVEVGITYKAKKATTLLPASAVRNEGENSDYVYLIQRNYGGLLTSSSMKVVKTSVRVLERGEKLVSIEDDLSYQQVADKEDRELTDNQTVMEYVN